MAVSAVEAKSDRGIPTAEFIGDVPTYLSEQKMSPSFYLKTHRERYNKYKFMESRILKQKAAVSQKIPDIDKALESIRFLISRKDDDTPIQTHYKLAGTVHMKANIEGPKTVFLWLGAKVMLEYEYEEALELLERNRKTALENLESLNGDLNVLKDQVTTTEVNIARVHNYNVSLTK